jgi:hypothetical protein
MNLLTDMNNGIKTLQTNMTSVTTGLEKNTTELATFKTEIGAKVKSLEEQFQGLKDDVETRLDEYKNEVRAEVAEEVESKLSTWKRELKDEIIQELKSDMGSGNISLNPPGMPSTNIGQKFKHLLRLSRSLENNFCMGHSKQKTPTVSAKSVLRQFFPEFSIDVGSKNSAALVRFSVPPKKSAQFRAKLQEVRGAILTYGWWVAQENPSDLRAMYTVTNDFLKHAKTIRPELKAFFLTIECGWVFYRDLPIIPVFLVPADSLEWDVLAGLLLLKLKGSKGINWLERVSETPKADVSFLGKWLAAMKLKQDLVDALAPLLSVQDKQDDSMGELAEELEG